MQEEDIKIINIYEPSIGVMQYVRQMLTNMKGEINNDTMDQLDLTDIYRTFHLKRIKFIFFSSAHATFSRIDHILGHKSCLGKLKKKLKSFPESFLTTMQ